MRPALPIVVALAVAVSCSSSRSGSGDGGPTPTDTTTTIDTTSAGAPDGGASQAPDAGIVPEQPSTCTAWVDGAKPAGFGDISEIRLLAAGAEDGVALVRDALPPTAYALARFDGTCWARIPGSELTAPANGSFIGSVAGAAFAGRAASSRDVWVGTSHFDGQRWTAYATPPSDCGTRMSGTASDDVWLVGATSLCHWDGTSWSAVATLPADFALQGLWSDRRGSAWLLGWRSERIYQSSDYFVDASRHVIVHWNGTGFDLGLEGPRGANEFALYYGYVGGAGPTAGWAFGSGGTFRFDGTVWNDYVLDPSCTAPGFVNALWASPSGEPWGLKLASFASQGGDLVRLQGTCWVVERVGPWVSGAGGWLADSSGGLWRAGP